jgi:hypothetical protein
MNPLFGDGCIIGLHLQLSDIAGTVTTIGPGQTFAWGLSPENITHLVRKINECQQPIGSPIL